MKQKILKPEVNARWSGEPVSKEILIPLIRRAISPEQMAGRIHYELTYPGYQRTADTLFFLRLNWNFNYGRVKRVYAAFDGTLQEREIRDGDMEIGSYNSYTRILNQGSINFCVFSIIFHLHLIRLYYRDYQGKEIVTQYYHTPQPARGTLLQMVRTLDSLVNDRSDRKDDRARLLVEAIGKQLLYELENTREDAPKERLAVSLKDYMDHYFYSSINCSSICEALGVNRSYASTVFHRNYGIAMNDYLTQLRLDAAEFLLKSEQKIRIDDIARFCSFADANYFARLFRKRRGMSPQEYRKKFRPADGMREI